MVHLQRSLLYRHALYAHLQRTVHHHARRVKVFVINAIDQHEVAELVLRYILAPRHLLACAECIAHLLQEELRLVVGQVRKRHVGIEELHGLALGAGEGVEPDVEHRELGHAGLKVGMHLVAIAAVGDEMGVAVARGKGEQHGQQRDNAFHISVFCINNLTCSASVWVVPSGRVVLQEPCTSVAPVAAIN